MYRISARENLATSAFDVTHSAHFAYCPLPQVVNTSARRAWIAWMHRSRSPTRAAKSQVYQIDCALAVGSGDRVSQIVSCIGVPHRRALGSVKSLTVRSPVGGFKRPRRHCIKTSSSTTFELRDGTSPETGKYLSCSKIRRQSKVSLDADKSASGRPRDGSRST